MDHTGHTTLAEWSPEDQTAYGAAVAEFRAALDEGCIAVVSESETEATQVRELPREADLVILRRPISGG